MDTLMCLGLAFVGTGVQKAYSYTVLLEDYSNLFPQTTRAWYRVFLFCFFSSGRSTLNSYCVVSIIFKFACKWT